MIHQIQSFQELSETINTYFLDMFGVLWNGEDFYPGVLDTLKNLKSQGKKICIVSNMTLLSSVLIESKEKHGLIKGVHFDEAVTSGDVFYHEIYQNRFLEKTIGKENYRLYNIGSFNKALFNGIESHLTSDLSQADGVYVSALNVSDISELQPVIADVLKYRLPLFCANPDVFFMKNDEKLPAQGALAKIYQEKGGTVYYWGKPYPDIFETALKKTNARKESTLMVGDMLETDIKGGSNAGLKTLLISQTGITAHRIKSGESLDSILKESALKPDYVKSRFAD